MTADSGNDDYDPLSLPLWAIALIALLRINDSNRNSAVSSEFGIDLENIEAIQGLAKPKFKQFKQRVKHAIADHIHENRDLYKEFICDYADICGKDSKARTNEAYLYFLADINELDPYVVLFGLKSGIFYRLCDCPEKHELHYGSQ